MTKEIIRLGMTLVQHTPVNVVDDLLVRLSKFVFGDLSRHGIVRPKIGPLQLKAETGRSAVIDVGTVGLIKKGIIKVSIFSHVTNFFYNKISPSIYSCLFNISGAWKYFQNQGQRSRI